MREGGLILGSLLQRTASRAVEGISTKELSDYVAGECQRLGIRSATYGYGGFPEVICTSLNNEVVHGIPSKKTILKKGDILGLDITIEHRGLVVDTATTLYIGDDKTMPADVKRLLQGSSMALQAGIEAISGAGTRTGDISTVIQTVLETHQLGIVRDLVGHGVGYGIHEDPNIPNYGHGGTGASLRAGMTLAIEPMATLGGWQVDVLPDGWTIVTRDHSLAAHFEHTVLVTESGVEILTLQP